MNTTIETVEQLPLEQLHAGDNIRRRLGDIAQLAASIESTGVHEPLIVRPFAGTCSCPEGAEHWELVAGHRRAAAARRAGLDTVSCIVRDLDDADVDDVMLIENLQREDLPPLDEADGLLRLVTRGMTIKDPAERIGRTQKHVSGRLDLLNLPTVVTDLLDAGDIGIGQAHTLGEALDSDDGQLVAEHLGYEEYSRLVAEAAGGHNPAWKIKSAADAIRADQLRTEIEAAAAAGDGPPLIEQVKTETSWGHEMRWPKGVKALKERDLGWNAKHIGITEAKHRKEPCHAVAVYGAEVVPVCSDWHRHKPDGDGHPSALLAREVDERAEAKAARAAERQRERDHDARTAALIDAADPRELITHALQHGARQEAARHNASVTNRAADILDIEYGDGLHEPPEGSWSNRSHSERALRTHIGESQAGAVRVLTVLAALHYRTHDDLTELLDRYAPTGAWGEEDA